MVRVFPVASQARSVAGCFHDRTDKWAGPDVCSRNSEVDTSIMGLFDLFSNDKAEEAAAQRNAGLQQGYDALSSTYGQGRDAINAGAATAQGYFAPLMAKYGAGS